MRIPIPLLVLLPLVAGCSKSTKPGTANVVLDSTTVDTVAYTTFQAFAVHNAGKGTAYNVRVYWHLGPADTAEFSLTAPADLVSGQAAHARGAAWGNPSWTYPTTSDSIRWSAAP